MDNTLPTQLEIEGILYQLTDSLQLTWGQQKPRIDANQQWPMSNNALYFYTRTLATQADLATVQNRLDQQEARMNAMDDVLALNAENYQLNFSLLNSQRQADLTAFQQLQAEVQLQAAKDELQDAAIENLQLQADASAANDLVQAAGLALVQAKNVEQDSRLALDEARQTVAEAEATRNRLADERDAAQTLLNTANIEKQRLQLIADETNIEADRQAAAVALKAAQTAQTTAEQALAAAQAADTKATNANKAAATAQAKADLDEQNITLINGQITTLQAGLVTANQNLTTQTIRVDAAVASISVLTTNLATAKATADSAQAAVVALQNKGRVLTGVAVPGVSILKDGTQEVAVTITPAMSDALYGESIIQTSGVMGNTNFTVKPGSKTVNGFVLVRSNSGTLTLVAPAATVDIIISQKTS